ncbi:hypothetical protein [Endozoicomonas euniceicola]|uniref:Uncharacterized protein n=1 Tax=Endozoicomonas euniceicola TaxID=1234143 RepID=A0ABY6GNA4_9GAMM|nr:hypothetical protein [Endozoicomonas euniceicola]UYM14183.1 hypothetical protein NX720_14850 [Endozoicomonas euniceicola]
MQELKDTFAAEGEERQSPKKTSFFEGVKKFFDAMASGFGDSDTKKSGFYSRFFCLWFYVKNVFYRLF